MPGAQVSSARSNGERGTHPETPERALPEMALGCVLGALFVALADVLYAASVAAAARVTPGELVFAALDLVAFTLPVGLAVGIGLGLALALVRASPYLSGLRAFYGSPSRWLRPEPERFAQPLAWLGTLGAVFVTVAYAYGDFAARFHRQDLAAYALGGVVVGLFAASYLLYGVLRLVLLRVAALLGRLATFATILVLVGPSAVATLVVLSRSAALEGVDDVAFVAIPVFVVSFFAGPALVLARARRRSTREIAMAGALTVVGVALAYLAASSTYGTGSWWAGNRVRSVVEQRSLFGARLVRFYASRADADHDGFTASFGGGDCDDGDAHIYPGAPDTAGDGVDADCFAGDGSPDVVPRGDGRYGTRPRTLAQPSFVVVTIDALRRDHLGVNGYGRATSPHIDAFARTAVQFTGAIPSSSRSLRSIPGMWTGLYPSEIAWGPEYLWPSLLPANESVAEVLQAHGYRTGAVMATNYFQRVVGFFQGFDTARQFEVYDPPRARAMDEALPILEELASGDAPFLLWVHLFNCHAPYLQDGVPSRFGPEEMDRYDSEIVYADEQFQRILDAIDARGLAERTVVVLASDHGEAFGEHGTWYHSTTLYEEEMRPMFFVRVPGIPAARVDGNVSLVDLAPTIAELAGVRLAHPISGESLLPLMSAERGADPERTVIAELLPDGLHPYDVKVLRRGSEKLMWWSRDGRIQLFDLASDPAEMLDLSDDRPAEAARLLGELRAWTAAAGLEDNRAPAFVAAHRSTTPPTPRTRLEAVYPGFELLGLTMPAAHVRRGDQLPLDLYWHVSDETDRDLFFRVTVEAPPGVSIPEHFHCWHYPLQSMYRTYEWHAGEYLDDPCTMRIPSAEEMAITETAHFRLVLQVLDADQSTVEGLSGGVPVSTLSLGGFDVDP